MSPLSHRIAGAMPLFLLALALICFGKPYTKFLGRMKGSELDESDEEFKFGMWFVIYPIAAFLIWGGVEMMLGHAHWKR